MHNYTEDLLGILIKRLTTLSELLIVFVIISAVYIIELLVSKPV